MTTTAEPTTTTTTCPNWCVDHEEDNGISIHLGPLSKIVSSVRVQASLRDDSAVGDGAVVLHALDARDGVVDCISAENARKLARYLLKAAQLADAAR